MLLFCFHLQGDQKWWNQQTTATREFGENFNWKFETSQPQNGNRKKGKTYFVSLYTKIFAFMLTLESLFIPVLGWGVLCISVFCGWFNNTCINVCDTPHLSYTHVTCISCYNTIAFICQQMGHTFRSNFSYHLESSNTKYHHIKSLVGLSCNKIFPIRSTFWVEPR